MLQRDSSEHAVRRASSSESSPSKFHHRRFTGILYVVYTLASAAAGENRQQKTSTRYVHVTSKRGLLLKCLIPPRACGPFALSLCTDVAVSFVDKKENHYLRKRSLICQIWRRRKILVRYSTFLGRPRKKVIRVRSNPLQLQLPAIHVGFSLPLNPIQIKFQKLFSHEHFNPRIE
jgi:hypothetical protein